MSSKSSISSNKSNSESESCSIIKTEPTDMNNRIKSPTSVSFPDTNSIVEIVECLQQRKMKPDVDKIVTYFEKNWPKVYNSDTKIVNTLVDDCLARGMIVSVNNQNVTSFRTPSKIGRMLRITKILPYDGEIPKSVVHDIIRSIGEIEIASPESTEEVSCGMGVTIGQLTKYLHENLRFLNYSDEVIEHRVFPLALTLNYLVKISDDRYSLTDSYRKDRNIVLLSEEDNVAENENEEELNELDSGEEKSEEFALKQPNKKKYSKSPEKSNKYDSVGETLLEGFRPVTRRRQNDTSIDIDDEEESSKERDSKSESIDKDLDIDEQVDTPKYSSPNEDAKISEPKDSSNVPQRVSTRKKFKKSLGPDFVDTSEQLMYYLKESNSPKCYICSGGFPKTKATFAKKRYAAPDLEPSDTNMISCNQCDVKVHVLCLTSLTESVGLKYQWRCGSCGTCANCKQNKKKDFCIACKTCRRSFHTNCCKARRNINEPSDSAWECERCHNRTVDNSSKNSSILLNKNFKSNPIVSTSSPSSSQVDTSKNRNISPKSSTVPVSKSLISKVANQSVSVLKSNTSLLSKSTSSMDSPSSSKSLLIPIATGQQASTSKEDDDTDSETNPSTKEIVDEFVEKHMNGMKVDKPTAELLSDPAVRDFLLRGPHTKKKLPKSYSIMNNVTNGNKTKSDSQPKISDNSKQVHSQSSKDEAIKEKHYFNFKDVFNQKSSVEIKQNFVAWVNCELLHFVKFDPTPLFSLHNNVNRWEPKDVFTFLSVIGFNDTAKMLLDNNVDGIALLLLRREDILERLSLKMGPALKLYAYLSRLRQNLDEID